LNAHPNIAIPEEVVYFNSVMAGVPIEQWQRPPLSTEAYASFVSSFLQDRCEALDGIDRVRLKKEILEGGEPDFRRPYRTVLEAWARHHGKSRWGEKTPGNLFYADVLLAMFPDAKFIHVVRDPRAGVSSMMGTTFFPNDIVFNAMSRHKFMTEGRRLLEQAVPAAQRMTLRYEDLVTEPEEIVSVLCDFLEEEFDPEMLAFYKESSRYMKEEAANSFNQAATKPISSDRLDAWKKRLSQDAIAKIESVCRQEMEEFGYRAAGGRLRLEDRFELAAKRMYWQWQVWRNRHVRHFTVKSVMFARSRHRLFKSA
jgi:hypothetical protein